METQKDPILWEMAHRRASFKRHLYVYLTVTLGLWLVWGVGIYFNSTKYPWPIWPSFGWGIGLLSHFSQVYLFNKDQLVENEYQKLLNSQSNH